MKFIVIGASGFIGSYLCQCLAADGHQVTALSRSFSDPVKKALRAATLLECDIMSEEFEALDLQAEVVIHLAAANEIVSRNFMDGLLLSVDGSRRVGNLLHRNGISKLIFFSTLRVYGINLEGTISEQSPVCCENAYALNHYFAEEYLRLLSKQSAIQLAIIRATNIFGPFLDVESPRWNLVPACFCKSIIETGKIQLRSSGLQIRNFASLEDAYRLMLIFSSTRYSGVECVNLVSPYSMSIIEMAKVVQLVWHELSGINAPIEALGALPKYSNKLALDDRKIKELGFTSTAGTTLGATIRQLFALLQSQ